MAIWMLDRTAEGFARDAIELIDTTALIHDNPRAFRQRGIFTRIFNIDQPLSDLLGETLTRNELPSSEREFALGDLDEMMSNAATLFADLEGVAHAIKGRFAPA